MTHFRMAPAMAWMLALAAPTTYAANAFYVDANAAANGNGSLAAPFRTIDQVNKAQYPVLPGTPPTIVEGDSVNFKCGTSWPGKSEMPTTLQLKTGVKYNSYYSSSSFPIYGCASTTTPSLARPVLRGSVKLSGLTWNRDTTESHRFWADVSTVLAGTDSIAQLVDPATSRRLQRARFPNIGAGNYAGISDSRYVHVGPDTPTADNGPGPFTMQLDPTAMPPAGTDLTTAKAFVRTHDWLLSKFNVTQHAGDKITIAFDDPNHQYLDSVRRLIWGQPEETGGYWLENQKWMLDSADEWFEERSGNSRKLYVWRTDGTPPPSSTTYYASVNHYGITGGMSGDVLDASKIANNFSLKNIEVQDTVLDGIAIMGKPNDPYDYPGQGAKWALNAFTVDGVSVSRAGRFGITVRTANGVTGTSANTIVIKNALVQYSMDRGIDSGDAVEPTSTGTAWMVPSVGVDVLNNTLKEIGTDRFALSAIRVAGNSTVMGNTITNAVSRAIEVMGAHSAVRSNAINGACVRMDDCGAIYTHGGFVPNNNLDLVVRGNVIESVGGAASIDGRHPHNPSGNMGVYLDDNASYVTVDGNSITGADVGIFLHGSKTSVVSNNIVDLSRWAALSFGPSGASDAAWESANNQIINNAFLSRVGLEVPAIRMISGQSPALPAFATFSGNAYGARTATPFWDETSTDSVVKSNFAQWQAMGRDGNGRIYLDIPAYVPTSTPAVNLISNSGFDVDASKWASANTGVLTVTPQTGSANCNGSGACIRLDRLDNTYDWVTFYSIDQAFTATAGKTYLLMFDARSASKADSLMVMLNRAGMASALSDWTKVSITTQWKRHAIPLLATASATDGRVDIFTVNKGSSIYLDNIRLVETTRQQSDETKSFYMAYNKTKTAQQVACGATLSTNCGAYKDLQTASSVSFPLTLDPWNHKALYWDASPWKDQDGDGISDKVDICPNTPAGIGANEAGCGFGQ